MGLVGSFVIEQQISDNVFYELRVRLVLLGLRSAPCASSWTSAQHRAALLLLTSGLKGDGGEREEEEGEFIARGLSVTVQNR